MANDNRDDKDDEPHSLYQLRRERKRGRETDRQTGTLTLLHRWTDFGLAHG